MFTHENRKTGLLGRLLLDGFKILNHKVALKIVLDGDGFPNLSGQLENGAHTYICIPEVPREEHSSLYVSPTVRYEKLEKIIHTFPY